MSPRASNSELPGDGTSAVWEYSKSDTSNTFDGQQDMSNKYVKLDWATHSERNDSSTTGPTKMADAGDLSNLLIEGSIPDLSWLDVGEKELREMPEPPRQCLDVIPELEEAMEFKAVNRFNPNSGAPIPTVGKVVSKTAPSEVARVARLTVMQSLGRKDWRSVLSKTLLSRFSKDTLQEYRDVVKATLDEHGLLGGHYVAAEDFPACASGGITKASEFVRKYASQAPYVLAKTACSGCRHADGGRCAVFQKELVLEVPYTPKSAAKAEKFASNHGKVLTATADKNDFRERVRAACLAEMGEVASPVIEGVKPVEDTTRLLKATTAPKKVHLPVLSTKQASLRDQLQQVDLAALTSNGKTASSNRTATELKGLEVIAVIQREMVRGRGPKDLLATLRVAFSADDLKATRSYWESVYQEGGRLGTLYVTPEVFPNCQKGAEFVGKHNPSIPVVVASDACHGCTHNKLGHCGVYNRKLASTADELFTSENVKAQYRRLQRAGKAVDMTKLASDPKQALRQLHLAAHAPQDHNALTAKVTGHFGSSSEGSVKSRTKDQIVKFAREQLNAGLFGASLGKALRRKFASNELEAAKDLLRPHLAEQGLQGHTYVDAEVYADYGRGCHEAARLHRASKVPYVKMGSSCEGCLNRVSGNCTKLAKKLVVEPPYKDKAAQQREVLASSKKEAKAEPHFAKDLAAYEMGSTGLEIPDLAPTEEFSILMGGQKL